MMIKMIISVVLHTIWNKDDKYVADVPKRKNVSLKCDSCQRFGNAWYHLSRLPFCICICIFANFLGMVDPIFRGYLFPGWPSGQPRSRQAIGETCVNTARHDGWWWSKVIISAKVTKEPKKLFLTPAHSGNIAASIIQELAMLLLMRPSLCNRADP